MWANHPLSCLFAAATEVGLSVPSLRVKSKSDM